MSEPGEVELDPRWEWHLVQRLGMPDMWVKARCLHAEVIPVESVTGEVVAQLCLTCDAQFPAPADAAKAAALASLESTTFTVPFDPARRLRELLTSPTFAMTGKSCEQVLAEGLERDRVHIAVVPVRPAPARPARAAS